MSAYFVEKTLIDALVSYAADRKLWATADGASYGYVTRGKDHNPVSPTAIGRMLWLENVASLEARYPNDADNAMNRGDAATYAFRYVANVSPREALQLAECLDYQSCEHDGWRTSLACQFLARLTNSVANQLAGEATTGTTEILRKYDPAPVRPLRPAVQVPAPNVIRLAGAVVRNLQAPAPAPMTDAQRRAAHAAARQLPAAEALARASEIYATPRAKEAAPTPVPERTAPSPKSKDFQAFRARLQERLGKR